MHDELLIMNKLNRWFWFYGVFPLVISYLICLNFAAEFVDITLKERPSITLFYMGELLGYTTLGMAVVMILWCNINAIRVHKISSQITSSKFKIKKFLFNTSVIFFPLIAFIGFIPLALTLFDKKLYFPLFPIIEPVAQNLTPYFFPVYKLIKSSLFYISSNVLYY